MSQNQKQHKSSVQIPTFRQAVLILLVGSIILLGISSFAFAETNVYSIPWWTIDNGGGISSGGVYTVAGTMGQPEPAEPAASTHYSVQGGFWAGINDFKIPTIDVFLPALMR